VQIDDALVDCFGHGNASFKGAIAPINSAALKPNALAFGWQACASSKARRSTRSGAPSRKKKCDIST
jgi:hypothetical protein